MITPVVVALALLVTVAVLFLLSRPAWVRAFRDAWVRRSVDRARSKALRAASRQYETRAQVLARWRSENWWRYPPPEGWRPGFNCDRLPMAAHLYVAQHGRIVTPTDQEIQHTLR